MLVRTIKNASMRERSLPVLVEGMTTPRDKNLVSKRVPAIEGIPSDPEEINTKFGISLDEDHQFKISTSRPISEKLEKTSSGCNHKIPIY